MYICLYKTEYIEGCRSSLILIIFKKKTGTIYFFNYLVFILTVLALHCDAWTSLVVGYRLGCPTAKWDISSLTKN